MQPEPSTQVYCPACGAAFEPALDFCPSDGTRLNHWDPSRDPLCGTVIDGRFRIVRPIGEGGMGRVYEAIQLSVDRAVAIKVIREGHDGDRSVARRFLREAKLLTSFNHPNIVNVFDYGQTARGDLYLVMELLRGRTLHAELAIAGGRFDPARACELVLQLCDALIAAHGRGVVHRDLKPSNVVILEAPAVRDLVKVLDFGLAKSLLGDGPSELDPYTTLLTGTGELMGTPQYMAPEAISGSGTDSRADLYALGCIFYELLSGASPFADSAVHRVLARHLGDPPDPLPASVPPPLAELVMQLLAKAPDDRPATAAVVRLRIRDFLAGETHTEEDWATLRRRPAPPLRRPAAAPSFPTERHIRAAKLLAIFALVAAITWIVATAAIG